MPIGQASKYQYLSVGGGGGGVYCTMEEQIEMEELSSRVLQLICFI